MEDIRYSRKSSVVASFHNYSTMKKYDDVDYDDDYYYHHHHRYHHHHHPSTLLHRAAAAAAAAAVVVVVSSDVGIGKSLCGDDR